jgi:hypothetical protein
MGYHRDGELLNLNLFETEMRRRIWWAILLQDAKAAISSGLSHSLLPLNWDTKEPSNFNDTDLVPGSTEHVIPRDGPTEMGFCLLIYRLANFMLSTAQVQGLLAFDAAILAEDTESHRETLKHYQIMLDDLDRSLMEAEEKFIDKSLGGSHAAAATIRPKFYSNLRELLVPMRDQPEWGTEILGPKDNIFKIMIMNNENAADAFTDLTDAGFIWFAKMHVQLDVFAVMTGQLCQHPVGSLADRAWKAIEKMHIYNVEMMDMSHKPYALQAQLTLKAWKTREQALCQIGQAAPTPSYIMQLQENLQLYEENRSTRSATNTPSMAQQSGDIDQFVGFGSYLDVSTLNWDVWGEINPNTNWVMPPQPNDHNPLAVYNNADMGNMQH